MYRKYCDAKRATVPRKKLNNYFLIFVKFYYEKFNNNKETMEKSLTQKYYYNLYQILFFFIYIPKRIFLLYTITNNMFIYRYT